MRDEEGEDADDEGRHGEEVQVGVAFEEQQANYTGHCRHDAFTQEQDEVTHTIDGCHLQSVVYYRAECLEIKTK